MVSFFKLYGSAEKQTCIINSNHEIMCVCVCVLEGIMLLTHPTNEILTLCQLLVLSVDNILETVWTKIRPHKMRYLNWAQTG